MNVNERILIQPHHLSDCTIRASWLANCAVFPVGRVLAEGRQIRLCQKMSRQASYISYSSNLLRKSNNTDNQKTLYCKAYNTKLKQVVVVLNNTTHTSHSTVPDHVMACDNPSVTDLVTMHCVMVHHHH